MVLSSVKNTRRCYTRVQANLARFKIAGIFVDVLLCFVSDVVWVETVDEADCALHIWAGVHGVVGSLAEGTLGILCRTIGVWLFLVALWTLVRHMTFLTALITSYVGTFLFLSSAVTG